MADDWLSVCFGKKTAWSIPDPALEELLTLKGTAATALETAKNETTRTPAKRQSLLAWSLVAIGGVV
jgi:hypothetical protein